MKSKNKLKSEYKSKSRIELLSPAGDFECLQAAINAGADAVYFGLQEFNMRARAKNFRISDLPKIKKICKANNVKCYLTLNTIIYDNEMKKLKSIIKKSKPYVNAIICSDLAVMILCKKHKIPFHVSTQCSISNSETAKFYKKLGAERIILARELNLKQIKKISKILPIETFVHGAMCVSVSGRCFTSQFLFNKSANRGECLHPCRRFYNVKDEEGNELKVGNNFVFSAKDLCALPFIEKLKKANISAFKIEGRNREPEYVYTVTKIYRKALDKKLNKTELEESLKELKKVYNKGFSSGFYLKTPASDDFAKTENSASTQTKQFIGKIYHYYPKIKVGLLKLNTGKLKIGDEIFIMGKSTGLLKIKIESMQMNHQPINEAKKGDEIGIKLSKPPNSESGFEGTGNEKNKKTFPACRKGDEVYRIVKNRKV